MNNLNQYPLQNYNHGQRPMNTPLERLRQHMLRMEFALREHAHRSDTQFQAMQRAAHFQSNFNNDVQRQLAALNAVKASNNLNTKDPVVHWSSFNSHKAMAESQNRRTRAYLEELEDTIKGLEGKLKEQQAVVRDIQTRLTRSEMEYTTGHGMYQSPSHLVRPIRRQSSPLIPMAPLPTPLAVSQYMTTDAAVFDAKPYIAKDYTCSMPPKSKTYYTYVSSPKVVSSSTPFDFKTPADQISGLDLVQTPSRSELNNIEHAVGSSNASPIPARFPVQDLGTLVPYLFYRIEVFFQRESTIPTFLVPQAQLDSSGLVAAAEAAAGKAWLMRELMDSPSRYFLITTIVNTMIVDEVFDVNIIKHMNTDLAIQYNKMQLDNYNYWKENGMAFSNRGKRCKELSTLAIQLCEGHGFWSWQELQVDRVTRAIIHKVGCLIPADRLEHATHLLRPIVDNAFRIKVRMLKENHEYHIKFEPFGERYDKENMIVRIDPVHPYTEKIDSRDYMIRMCITPTILEKIFGEKMTTRNINKCHVLLELKKQKRKSDNKGTHNTV
ncbi:hypothetical protein MBLNU459_g0468t1 [Dothideomycetes sp. NU459]